VVANGVGTTTGVLETGAGETATGVETDADGETTAPSALELATAPVGAGGKYTID
jgi:hypothetical protein